MKETEKYLFLKAEILAELKKIQSNLHFWLKNPQNDWVYQEKIVKAQTKVQILQQLEKLINYLDNNQISKKSTQSIQMLERCFELPTISPSTPEKE
ncbi:hypothetical protein [Laspinema olomoucense]|uniref:hypothetical protein n=1 Tax=Laspinema olomoucense TaxID=3231600 RepID=UPI0021BAC009|nr:hypothetical protein [Laspinema sp. D3c]MCT7992396.1 hypothetical protein [Laspinema sp. D3c]